MDTQFTDNKSSTSRPIWLFFGLAMILSWVIWIPMILFVPENAQLPLLLLGGFGPFMSALIVIRIKEGKTALKQWLRETFRLRIGLIWYLVGGLFLPFGIAILHHSFYILAGGRSGFSLDQIWGIYVVSLFSTTLLGGGFEEPGWRGFATPRLMTRFHPILANTIVSFFWVLWHIPLYFGNWGGKGQPLLWFFIYAIGLSIILTWLYFKSGKSIIPVMLLHGATNIVFDFFPATNTIFSSPDLDFNIFKSMSYWTVAIVIILATKGQLGYSIKSQEERTRNKQQVEATHA
ncbi:MAG: type II CAAX prenyl endopeptidase Rce1 family protein [Anaerolineales bacterium]